MPLAVSPETCWPAFMTLLPRTVMCVETLLTTIPSWLVPLTLKPSIVTYDLPLVWKPIALVPLPPVTVTVSPGTAKNLMGLAAVPELASVTRSAYVPPDTCTVPPAVTFDAAALIEQNGCVAEPGPVFEHFVLPFATYSVAALADAVVALS